MAQERHVSSDRPRAAAGLDFLDQALGGYGGRRDGATADAFERVGALMLEGRADKALAMLEYAQRLAPSDSGITLAIGLTRLKLGLPTAAAPLETLADRTDWRDVWMALVRVRMRFGAVNRAATDLQTALSRNGPPTKPHDIELANTVSRRSGGQGWCALSNSGSLIVASPHNLSIGLAILLDGIKITGGGLREAQGRHEFSLPENWQRASRLDVLLRGQTLIGSPIDIRRVTRVEGFVEAISVSGALRGWCWFPAERERTPLVTIASVVEPMRRMSIHAAVTDPSLVRTNVLGLPYGFAIEAGAIENLGDSVEVTGPHGRALYGSPVLLRGAFETGRSVVPSRPSADSRMSRVPPRPVDVVIPVYAGRDMTLACIDAVRAHLAADERIIVVADASPDEELLAALRVLAARGQIILQVETINRGFPGTANIGIRLAAGNDVVLLNADTVVTPGWLAGLREAVHQSSDIGTATPLSNDATIFSYPHRNGANAVPDAQAAAELAAIAALANGGTAVDVPTGHGFCFYIRAECLAETGVLREDCFAQGYGEENDFCMRARHMGWRHVAVPGVFVAHVGSQSFGGGRDDLMRRNIEILNRLHPGYDQLIAQWQSQDPLGESRRRMDLARLVRTCAGREAVLLVTHDRTGGVRHHVTERAVAIGRSGKHALVLRPNNAKGERGHITAHAVSLDTGFEDAYPNLRFCLPDDRAALTSCLRDCGVAQIEVNSLIGYADSFVDFIREHEIPYDVVVHDYSWFCPRITLTTGDHRYCGEPAMPACRECIATHGTNFDENVLPDELMARSRRLIGAARSITAPSADAARRIRDRFGVEVSVCPWEPTEPFRLRPVDDAAGRARPIRICIVGAISPEKGYHTLLDCAQYVAANTAPVEFVVVGYSCDDRRLLETGAVDITGRYEESELLALIAAQKADFGWLPAVWPETWSYVLTRLWEAGLFVVVHDIGAPAERVCANSGGLVAPLHLPPDRLIGLFLNPGLFRARPTQ